MSWVSDNAPAKVNTGIAKPEVLISSSDKFTGSTASNSALRSNSIVPFVAISLKVINSSVLPSTITSPEKSIATLILPSAIPALKGPIDIPAFKALIVISSCASVDISVKYTLGSPFSGIKFKPKPKSKTSAPSALTWAEAEALAESNISILSPASAAKSNPQVASKSASMAKRASKSNEKFSASK